MGTTQENMFWSRHIGIIFYFIIKGASENSAEVNRVTSEHKCLEKWDYTLLSSRKNKMEVKVLSAVAVMLSLNNKKIWKHKNCPDLLFWGHHDNNLPLDLKFMLTERDSGLLFDHA